MPGVFKKIFSSKAIMFWVALVFGGACMIIAFISLPLTLALFITASVIVFCAAIFNYALDAINKTEAVSFEQERAERLIANMADAVIGYDSGFKITLWNKAAETLFKIRREDIIDKTISPEKISDSTLRLLIQTVFSSLAPSVVQKSEPGVYPQLVDISFTDPELELSISTDRTMDGFGKAIGFFKIIRNRTRETELLRSKSEFITVAAHQLRTPLTAVHWIFETLIKNNSIAAPDKEVVENGLAASVKLLKIVNDLLDVSKIEAGRFGYNFANIDISVFMDDILKNANILAKEFGVSLYFDRPKTPISIFADSQKLGMAISNLIDNAIKYNVKNGQVIVKIEGYPGRPYIQITIRDTGVGIAPEDLKKLFTKFYRGENVVKEQTDGSGLGLYITKNIIVRHGGNISAESVLGRGTTFYIVLPTDPSLIPPKEVAVGEI